MKRSHLFELTEDAFVNVKKALYDSYTGMDATEKIQLVDTNNIWVFRVSISVGNERINTYAVLSRHGLYNLHIVEKNGEDWSNITDKMMTSIRWEAPAIQQSLETKQFGELKPLSFAEKKEISADGVTVGIPDGRFISTAAYDTGAKLICIMDQYDDPCSFLRIKDGVQAAMTLQKAQEHGLFYTDLSRLEVQKEIVKKTKRDLLDLPYTVISSSRDFLILSAKRGFEKDTTKHYTELFVIYTSRKVFIGMIMLNGEMTEEEGHKETEKWVRTIRFDASKTSVKPKIVFFTDDHPEGIPSGIDLPEQNVRLPEKSKDQILSRDWNSHQKKRIDAQVEVINALLKKCREVLKIKSRWDSAVKEAHDRFDPSIQKTGELIKKSHEENEKLRNDIVQAEQELSTQGLFALNKKKELKNSIQSLNEKMAKNRRENNRLSLALQYYQGRLSYVLEQAEAQISIQTDFEAWKAYQDKLQQMMTELEKAQTQNMDLAWEVPDLPEAPTSTEKPKQASSYLSEKTCIDIMLGILACETAPITISEISIRDERLKDINPAKLGLMLDKLVGTNVDKVTEDRRSKYKLL